MIAELMRYAAALLILAGAGFCVIAAIGVLRLPDLYTRLHAASKAGAVGAGLILVAVALSAFDGAVALRALLGIIFLLLSTPLAAHLLARAAHSGGERAVESTTVDDLT